jgi:hypothetical protein
LQHRQSFIKHVKLLQNEYPKYTQKQLEDMMANVIKKYTIPAYLEDLNDEWWNDAKLSDEWLDKIFPEFYKQLRLDKNSFNFNMFGSCHQQHTDEMQHKKQELQSWLPRIDR